MRGREETIKTGKAIFSSVQSRHTPRKEVAGLHVWPPTSSWGLEIPHNYNGFPGGRNNFLWGKWLLYRMDWLCGILPLLSSLTSPNSTPKYPGISPPGVSNPTVNLQCTLKNTLLGKFLSGQGPLDCCKEFLNFLLYWSSNTLQTCIHLGFVQVWCLRRADFEEGRELRGYRMPSEAVISFRGLYLLSGNQTWL